MLTAMSEPLPHERREHARVSLTLAVRYPDHDAFLDDWTENVSEGGLFVQSEDPRAPGERVQLELRFPGLLEPIQLVGTVTWVREKSETERAGFGLRVDREGHRRRLAELALIATREHAHRDGEPFRVLVVEDNESVVEMYARVMKRVQRMTEGSVLTHFAENGFQARELLASYRPDLILTDLYMPVMDGLELSRYVKTHEALQHTPVMVITAGAEDERVRAAELGIDAFLQKPVQFGQILETIARLLWQRGRTDGEERQERQQGSETPSEGALGAVRGDVRRR